LGLQQRQSRPWPRPGEIAGERGAAPSTISSAVNSVAVVLVRHAFPSVIKSAAHHAAAGQNGDGILAQTIDVIMKRGFNQDLN
jgi:hypothetical protein